MHSNVVLYGFSTFGLKLCTNKVIVPTFHSRKWRRLLNSETKITEMLCNRFTFFAREAWYFECL